MLETKNSEFKEVKKTINTDIQTQMEAQETEIAFLERFLEIRKQLKITNICSEEDASFLEEHQDRILKNCHKIVTATINQKRYIFSQADFNLEKIQRRQIDLMSKRNIPIELELKAKKDLAEFEGKILALNNLIQNFTALDQNKIPISEYFILFLKFIKIIQEITREIELLALEISKNLKAIRAIKIN